MLLWCDEKGILDLRAGGSPTCCKCRPRRSSRRSQEERPPIAPTGATRQPLSGSNLAALNWIDESSHERHTIFYQLDGALFVSQVQGQDKTWTHLNSSTQFVPYRGDLALNQRNGASLAVAATPWQAGKSASWDGTAFAIALYYFDEANQVPAIDEHRRPQQVAARGGTFIEVATVASPSSKSQLAAATEQWTESSVNNE
jgi:hypothetical protein